MNNNLLTFGDHFKYKNSYSVSFGNLPGKELIGFPRYVASQEGRLICSQKYKKLKVSFDGLNEALKSNELKENYEFYNYFGQNIFQFDKTPQKYYLPDEKLKEILSCKNPSGINKESIELYKLVQSLFKKKLSCGIGGSILFDCASENSDVDLYFYENNLGVISKRLFKLFNENIFQGLNFDNEAPIRKSNWGKIFSKVGNTSDLWKKAYSNGKWVLEGYYKGRMFNFLFVLPRSEKKEKTIFDSFEEVLLEAKIVDDSKALMRPSEFIIKNKEHGKIHLLSYVRTHSILRKGDNIIVKGILQKAKNKKQITALWVENTPVSLIP